MYFNVYKKNDGVNDLKNSLEFKKPYCRIVYSNL